MQQSMHELLPEMVWQVGVLKRLDRIIELLESLEVPVDVGPAIFDDIIDWESTDVTDYVSM